MQVRRATRHPAGARELARGLRDLGRASSRSPDARTEVCDIARELLGADADVLLVPSDRELVGAAASGALLAPLRVAVDDPDSAAAAAYRDQELVFAGRGRMLDHPVLRDAGARAVVAVPVTRLGIRLGVNLWMWRTPKRRLSDREAQLAEALSEEKGMVIQRTETFVQAVELARAQARTALARDLHDALTQDVALLRVYAESADRALHRRPDVLEDVVPRLRTHAARADEALHEVLDTLGGEPLVELSIADMVDAVMTDFRKRSHLDGVTVELPGGDRGDVPPVVREAVYFVLHQALDNATAHAHARSVQVRTEAGPDAVTLTVADDGRGFDPVADPDGHGLGGMHDRARRAGGELEVRSGQGSGTTVTLRIRRPPPEEPSAEMWPVVEPR
jgi:signal transduction histidine kinase